MTFIFELQAKTKSFSQNKLKNICWGYITKTKSPHNQENPFKMQEEKASNFYY
jgi:hypothetical protein